MGSFNLAVTVISVLALVALAMADCGSDTAGRMIGIPVRFPDMVLSPSPYAQHVAFHDRCRNTNPATGLSVKACATYGTPTVLATDVENAQITCPYGCVITAYDYCIYGLNPSNSQ